MVKLKSQELEKITVQIRPRETFLKKNYNIDESFYTVPSGTYRRRDTRVYVESKDGIVSICSSESGKTIASHPYSRNKGSLVRNYDRQTLAYALQICLDAGAYNARMLMDIAEGVRIRMKKRQFGEPSF